MMNLRFRNPYIFSHTLTLAFVFLLLFACTPEKTIPKPSTYLRLDVPPAKYTTYQSTCGYSFDVDKLFTVKDVVDSAGNPTCHKDIYFNQLNGVLNFSYIEMERPLKDYIDYALNKVDEHKVKATAIDDTSFLYPDKKVYGTLFELKGDVASPFQFYLTDSTSRFVSGVVYFNAVPNYDSLRPTLLYLKKDLVRMMDSFKWK